MAALAAAGQPGVRIVIADLYQLGQEFFRWEIATAVAGSIIGINPFDQPDVEASKVRTRELTSVYERDRALPEETPVIEGDGFKLFADPANASALRTGGEPGSVASYLQRHLDRLGPGDYCALLTYVARNEAHNERLQAIRRLIRDRKHIATCLGFGPRFLHSTGQAYKGGPNNGVFLQITRDDEVDLQVPGQKYSFGVVKAAQARGDFEVLANRGRRALRVHLGADVESGLGALEGAVRQRWLE
jgi:transaldolase / glucose-6-phosphate isomerase